jgi:hypothetical protein
LEAARRQQLLSETATIVRQTFYQTFTRGRRRYRNRRRQSYNNYDWYDEESLEYDYDDDNNDDDNNDDDNDYDDYYY